MFDVKEKDAFCNNIRICFSVFKRPMTESRSICQARLPSNSFFKSGKHEKSIQIKINSDVDL